MTRRTKVRRRKAQNRLRRDWRWARSVVVRALASAASMPVDMTGLGRPGISYWAGVILDRWRQVWPEFATYSLGRLDDQVDSSRLAWYALNCYGGLNTGPV